MSRVNIHTTAFALWRKIHWMGNVTRLHWGRVGTNTSSAVSFSTVLTANLFLSVIFSCKHVKLHAGWEPGTMGVFHTTLFKIPSLSSTSLDYICSLRTSHRNGTIMTEMCFLHDLDIYEPFHLRFFQHTLMAIRNYFTFDELVTNSIESHL